MKKKIAIVLCTILLFVVGTLAVFAAPYPNKPSEQTPYPSHYDYPTTWAMVQAFEAQMKLASPSLALTGSYMSPADYAYPLFITHVYDSSTYTREYYAYVAYKGTASPVGVSSLPEAWGVSGAVVYLDNSASYVVRFRLYIRSDGGFYAMGQPSNWNSSTRSISLTNTTARKEQIVYLYSGVGIGFNELYSFGSAFLSNGQFDRWIDALDGYNNGVGASPEELESAYDDGYNVGYEDGLASGASAEEIESAYDDGYFDGHESGYVSGYVEGQRDGTAEIDIPGVIDSYFEGARTIFEGWFDYTIFGVNVMGLLAGLIVVAIVFFVLKKVK